MRFSAKSQRARLFCIFLLALALLWPASAHAQVITWSDPSWRPISGEFASHSEPSGYHHTEGIKTIEIEEVDDRPWLMRLERDELCHGNLTCPDGPVSEVEAPRGTAFRTVARDFIRASVGDDRYITAIQVCLSGQSNVSRRRVKGIRVWGATVTTSGFVRRDNVAHESKQTNCRVWYDKQMCLGNRVAIGARAYFDGTRSSSWFTGIALRCALIPQP